MKWLIIGISGVTCGGKTTIASELNKIFPSSKVICQDDYFLPVEDDRHVMIDHLNHINFDMLSSLDMEKMLATIKETIASSANIVNVIPKPGRRIINDISQCIDVQSSVLQMVENLKLNVLIIEGFCIFDHKQLTELCSLKYFVTLNRQECYNRRRFRVYEPPDCPGYFEDCAWPEYERYYSEVQKNVKGVQYFSEFTKDPTKEVLLDIWEFIQYFD